MHKYVEESKEGAQVMHSEGQADNPEMIVKSFIFLSSNEEGQEAPSPSSVSLSPLSMSKKRKHPQNK